MDIRISPPPSKFGLKIVAGRYLIFTYENLGEYGFGTSRLTKAQLSYAAMNATVLVWLLRYFATARWLLWKDGFILDDKVEKVGFDISKRPQLSIF